MKRRHFKTVFGYPLHLLGQVCCNDDSKCRLWFMPGADPVGCIIQRAGRQQVPQVALQTLDRADVAPALRLVRASTVVHCFAHRWLWPRLKMCLHTLPVLYKNQTEGKTKGQEIWRTDIWPNGCFGKKDAHPVHAIPNHRPSQNGYSSKNFSSNDPCR